MQKKKQLLQQLNANRNFWKTAYYEAFEQLGDLKTNCGDYMITELLNYDEKLKRLPGADYELFTGCSVRITFVMALLGESVKLDRCSRLLIE